jgi:periplasmic divalent cation tolerance protein
MAGNAVLVLTTWPAERDSAPLARTLVEERLAACVAVLGEMASTYRWAGRLETSAERQLIIKTIDDRVSALESRLRALHPYEVPEFLVLSTAGAGALYLAWLREGTTPV